MCFDPLITVVLLKSIAVATQEKYIQLNSTTLPTQLESNRTHIFRQQLESNSNHKKHNSNHESLDCESQLICKSKLLDAHCDHKVRP